MLARPEASDWALPAARPVVPHTEHSHADTQTSWTGFVVTEIMGLPYGVPGLATVPAAGAFASVALPLIELPAVVVA